MAMKPSLQQIIDDWRAGFVWLQFDLFKESGKWAYSGYVKCDRAKLQERVHKEGRVFLDYIESVQDEVNHGCFEDYYVTLDDCGMDLQSYHDFYKRMYKPCRRDL